MGKDSQEYDKKGRFNVLMILLDKLFPPDIRVEKEIKCLTKNGVKVYLLTRLRRPKNCGGPLGYIIDYGGLFRLVPRPLITIFYWTIFRIISLYRIVTLIKSHNIHVLHVHDLPFALTACIAGKLTKRPTVFDMHEDYIDSILMNLPPRFLSSFLFKIISKLLWVEEKFVYKLSSKILIVAEEEAERLKALNVPSGKIAVIPNTPDIDELRRIEATFKPVERRDIFKITYIGGFSRHRGLDVLIEAMPLILDSIPNARLFLIGDGDYKGNLLNLTKKLKLEDAVIFKGWLPLEEAMNYVMESDICVIPYIKCKETEKSFPHKLGQYMYFGKPILASNVKSLKRIIRSIGCGVLFEAGNERDLAEKLIKIKRNGSEILTEMGQKGKKAVISRYNWVITCKTLMNAYYQLLSPYRRKIFERC